ncbi:MAG TPA: PAS domain S-box protein [Fimbriimonadaceae bacterium]|jgi:PAS domain S-box-containing protein
MKGVWQKDGGILRFTADSAGDLLSYVDRNLRYQYANKAYEDWFGFPAADVCDKTMAEVLGPDGFEVVEPYALRALKGEKVSFEIKVHYKHAGLRHIDATFVPDFDPDGKVLGFAAHSRDITEAKRSEEAQRFLYEADLILASSLDFEATLQRVATAAAEHLADWVVVSMIEPSGEKRRIALAHRDPEKIQWALEMEKKYPRVQEEDSAEARVIKEGKPFLMHDVPEELIEKAARDEEHLKLLKGAQIKSVMIVPIKAQSTVLGTISYISSEMGRYDEETLKIAEEMTSRASLAIENARLYGEAKQEAEHRREATQRFRLIVASSLDAVISITEHGDILYWEGKAEKIFGWTFEEVVGKKVFDFIIPPENNEAYKADFERYIKAGKPSILNRTIEVGAVRKNGERFPAEVGISRVTSEGRVVFNAFLRDITERKAAEQAIVESEGKYQALAAELEERVLERTEQLEFANKELEAFSYSVSHDLRAPLRSISTFSQILLLEQMERLDEEGKDNLTRILDSSQRMSKLIDNLLQYARLARVELVFENLDLATLSQDIIANLRTREPNRNVDVQIPESLPIFGDRNLLYAALENLIENAWKFTGKVSDPCIEIGTGNENGENVYFVRDNGAGFDMKYASKLFRPFERLHGDSDYPGTGIGLVNVQRIVLRHGGRMWADAAPGKGATFFFTLGS